MSQYPPEVQSSTARERGGHNIYIDIIWLPEDLLIDMHLKGSKGITAKTDPVSLASTLLLQWSIESMIL